jgi:hypothetical protein
LTDIGAFESGGCVPPVFRRGDANGDGVVQMADGIRILRYNHTGGPPPVCYDAGDVDDDGNVTLTDAVLLFCYLFLCGPPPRSPGPLECGPDLTWHQRELDVIDCSGYEACPGTSES